MNGGKIQRRWRQGATLGVLLAAASGGLVGWMPAEGVTNGRDELGSAIYTNCAACHGDAGQGGFAPPLAANENLKNTEYVILHILTGSVRMPSFEDQLSREEIAAVVNHVRNSWGNRAERIAGADVANVEKQLGRHTVPHRTSD